VLDGELLIPLGASLSFDALQMRLHPAQSRIAKLSRESPALLMLFDMLGDEKGDALLNRPLFERRKALEEFYSNIGGDRLLLSPFTTRVKEARKWLARAGRGVLDGVVAPSRWTNLIGQTNAPCSTCTGAPTSARTNASCKRMRSRANYSNAFCPRRDRARPRKRGRHCRRQDRDSAPEPHGTW
jgi:hypothetical protein